MPWKIKRAKLSGDRPFMLMCDESVALYLGTELDTGVVDLFIGDTEPAKAAIHIVIDVDSEPQVKVERSERPSQHQVNIIANVLGTMKLPDSVRKAVYAQVSGGIRISGKELRRIPNPC